MYCPDQSSYELAHRASLLDGNPTLGGLWPPEYPKTWRRDCFATGEPARTPQRTRFRAARMLSLLYVMIAALRNQYGERAGQFMVAVCQPEAIATCALARPSVNCPN